MTAMLEAPVAEYVSVIEAAESLEVSRHTVYRWIEAGRIAATTNPLSETLAIPVSEVDRARPFVRRRNNATVAA